MNIEMNPGTRKAGELHPAATSVFFAAVIVLTMVLTAYPGAVAVSFAGAAALYVLLKGTGPALHTGAYLLPAILVMTLINLLVSHGGSRVMFYVNGNPFTADALSEGFFTGLMIIAVGLWFVLLGDLMTSDRIYYLFGKNTPRLALLFVMTVGFIPRLGRNYSCLRRAREGMYGRERTGRLKSYLSVLSALVSLSLEDAMATADSMAARGYGTEGVVRTCASDYRFTVTDGAVCVLSAAAFAAGIAAMIAGSYLLVFICTAVLAVTPLIFELGAELKWRSLKSKI